MNQVNSNPWPGGRNNEDLFLELCTPKVQRVNWENPGPASQHPLATLSNDLRSQHTEARNELSLEAWLHKAYKKALAGVRPKIIGVGESSHGCAVQFETQAKSAEYMIENLGARMIALEAPADSVVVLNWALNNSNAPIEDVPLAFPYITWTSPQLIKLFRWIQDWNKKNPSSLVQVVGIDPKLRVDPICLQGTFGDVKAFDLYQAAFAEFREADEKFRQAFESFRVEKKPLPVWEKFRNFEQSIKALREYVTQEGTPCRGLFECAIDALEWMQNPSVFHRDEVMAQALMRMVKSQGSQDSPVVLLAHSMHIGRLPKMLGGLLADEYKENYRAFCATSYGGTVTCAATESSKVKNAFILREAPHDAFERIFGSPSDSNFVDVRALAAAQSEVFEHQVPMRIAQGAGTQLMNDFAHVELATFCDGVFVHKEGHAVLIASNAQLEDSRVNVQSWLESLKPNAIHVAS